MSTLPQVGISKDSSGNLDFSVAGSLAAFFDQNLNFNLLGNILNGAISVTSGINGLATGSTLLYTNNSGKILIVSDVALFATTATTITSGPTAQIGSTSTGSDIYGSEVITALNAANAVYHFGGPGMSKVIPNAGTLYLDITVAGAGTGTPILTLEAVVSGVLV